MKKTITECLVELKTLSARIDKEINSTYFVTTFTGGNAPTGFKSIEDFEAKTKASFEKITDLISYRNKIKTLIVESNANTKVVIAGKEYTVAAAIERKSSIEFDKRLLYKIHSQTDMCYAVISNNNKQAQLRLDNLLNTSMGKDVKSDANDIKTITDNFMAKNETKLLDPINVGTISQKLSKEIEDFLSAVDVALSISNAITYVEID